MEPLKRKITIRPNGSRRVQLFNTEPSKTVQADKQSADINFIMEQYRKTGMLPHVKEKQALYADISNLPTLEEAFEQVQHSSDLFMQLPAAIRREMNNDPTQMEAYISDVNNFETLKKYGLVVPNGKPVPKPTPNPQKPSKSKSEAEE